jgi:hypothetical protein
MVNVYVVRLQENGVTVSNRGSYRRVDRQTFSRCGIDVSLPEREDRWIRKWLWLSRRLARTAV